MRTVAITGTGLYAPPGVVENEALVATFNTYVARENALHRDAIARGERSALESSSADFIVKASGIERRHAVNPEGILDPETMRPQIRARDNTEASLQCEMATRAAMGALLQANLAAGELDAIIVACSNLQRAYPAVAIEVQAALGAKGFAFDMNVACSSATFGINLARDMIAQGTASKVLVVSPEICTAHLNFRDRESHFIFGDACTAVILEDAAHTSSTERFELVGSKLITSYSNSIRNNLGFLSRCEPEEPLRDAPDKLFVQQGRKVFKEVSPMVAELIASHLSSLGIAPTSLKRLWLHQANLTMNQWIARKVLGRDPSEEEAPSLLHEYANTSSCGSIIAFHEKRAGLAVGDLGVICSFGAGYSAGSLVVRKLS
jgi:beta-ketodecanoyl-[acyl-carrier-protein] synthase